MKFQIFSLGLLFLLSSTVSARSAGGGIASGNDPSRTLKGVLKFYKDQPRETDSESIEFDSNEASHTKTSGSYRLDLNLQQIKEDQKLLTAAENFAKQNEKEVKVKPVETEKILVGTELSKDEETNFETTTLISISEDVILNSQYLSKSDLYSDDPEDMDMDGCNEGDVMRVSCNTCVCSDGKYFCSKRECNDKQTPLPPLPKASSKKKGAMKYHKIKIDVTSSSENGTNSIEVDDINNVNSTLGESANTTSVPPQCIDGRTKPVDCNQCVCALGKWACTKMSCIALSLREKASFSGGEFLKKVDTLKEYMNIDEDCMEGETKQLGCNQCVCHQNSWACSDFACPPTEAPVKLPEKEEACQTEEDVKSKDCNICSCRRGVWVCTTNDCKKFGDRYYNPVSLKHTSNENEQEI